MKNTSVNTLVILSFFVMAGCASPSADQQDVFNDAAVISFHAAGATVETREASRRIRLDDVSALATISSHMHVQNERQFDAFPIGELPDAWNSCNEMKFRNGWFHDDSVNTVITFDMGVTDHGHLSTAPLLTNEDDVKVVMGGDEGVMFVMLTDAAYEHGSLSFAIAGDVDDGTYVNVEFSTECLRER